jgi:hypothetical protein
LIHRRTFRYSSVFASLALAAAALALASIALSWGDSGHRLIISKAVDTLPDEMRPYFEANKQYLMLRVTEPSQAALTSALERQNQFIHLDHYGNFPFSTLPRDYKTAVSTFGKHSLTVQGLLPWQIGVYSQKMTDAFRAHTWDEVRGNAALLAFYVGEAHDPFKTTQNEDGKLSLQPGVSVRFDKSLVDRYSQFFYIHPSPAAYVQDPTDHAFEACMNAHATLESILLADRRSRAGLTDYTDEYYDRFYGQAGNILAQQISDAAADVGSYWLTSWVNAGKPSLPAR